MTTKKNRLAKALRRLPYLQAEGRILSGFCRGFGSVIDVKGTNLDKFVVYYDFDDGMEVDAKHLRDDFTFLDKEGMDAFFGSAARSSQLNTSKWYEP